MAGFKYLLILKMLSPSSPHLLEKCGPSAFTVFTAQSNAPLYGGSTPGSTFIFITLVLITSIGFEATDATKPATKLAATWVPIPSLSRPFSRIISLAWSYDASCDAVTIIARFTVRLEPRHRLATPSCFDICLKASTTLL
uniref:Uncharacterized protein n=1 Tax=Salix viminalis TaxID=40686 RepID=A0A6N2MWZ3_SALVM